MTEQHSSVESTISQIKQLQTRLRSLPATPYASSTQKESKEYVERFPQGVNGSSNNNLSRNAPVSTTTATMTMTKQPLEETMQDVSLGIKNMFHEKDRQIQQLQDELRRTQIVSQLNEERYLQEIRQLRDTLELTSADLTAIQTSAAEIQRAAMVIEEQKQIIEDQQRRIRALQQALYAKNDDELAKKPVSATSTSTSQNNNSGNGIDNNFNNNNNINNNNMNGTTTPPPTFSILSLLNNNNNQAKANEPSKTQSTTTNLHQQPPLPPPLSSSLSTPTATFRPTTSTVMPPLSSSILSSSSSSSSSYQTGNNGRRHQMLATATPLSDQLSASLVSLGAWRATHEDFSKTLPINGGSVTATPKPKQQQQQQNTDALSSATKQRLRELYDSKLKALEAFRLSQDRIHTLLNNNNKLDDEV